MVRIIAGLTIGVLPMFIMSCASLGHVAPHRPKYRVQRLSEPVPLDGKWDKPQWRNAQAVRITHYMGQRPKHRPKAQAKTVYDDQYIYVIFRVEDRYVRAVARENQGEVWKDSCVEFFFTPGEDVTRGYFNLEVNCGGTALFHFQKAPKQDVVSVSVASCGPASPAMSANPQTDELGGGAGLPHNIASA